MRGAEVRTPDGSILKRPITKLFPIESFECQLDENVGENASKNGGENVNENVYDIVVRPKRNVGKNVVRRKRNAAIVGEIRRRFTKD